jgi:hypothetical protein
MKEVKSYNWPGLGLGWDIPAEMSLTWKLQSQGNANDSVRSKNHIQPTHPSTRLLRDSSQIRKSKSSSRQDYVLPCVGSRSWRNAKVWSIVPGTYLYGYIKTAHRDVWGSHELMSVTSSMDGEETIYAERCSSKNLFSCISLPCRYPRLFTCL